MAIYNPMTDLSVLREFGLRVAEFRVRNNVTQADFAQRAGVSKSTVEKIEKGLSVQSLNLVKVVRACGALDAFLGILPEPAPSPMELLYLSKKQRKRVRASKPRAPGSGSSRQHPAAGELAGIGSVAEGKPTWVWDEDK
ncbi:MAG: helix-turn-helix transcriptional regulator [Fibrobacter sp.]|nr:helix-turn-helix transcriptional regulator [Fibrobacter sp.]